MQDARQDETLHGRKAWQGGDRQDWGADGSDTEKPLQFSRQTIDKNNPWHVCESKEKTISVNRMEKPTTDTQCINISSLLIAG